jgi:ABC-type bacteriocin/lantibiotic exporter with double-glycine peptidase domain
MMSSAQSLLREAGVACAASAQHSAVAPARPRGDAPRRERHLLRSAPESRELLAVSRRSRRSIGPWAAANALLMAAGCLAPAAAGLLLSSRGLFHAAAAGLAGAVILAARTAIQQSAAFRFRRAFFQDVMDRLSRRSALAESNAQLHQVEVTLHHSTHAATRLACEHVPAAAGGALAAVAIVPALWLQGAWTALVGTLVVLGVAAAGAKLLQRSIARSAASTWERSRDLVDATALLVRGHMDLTAAGRVELQAERVRERVDVWSRAFLRSERLSSLGGRLPAAVATAAAILLAWLWLRDAPDMLLRGLARGLLVGSVLPIAAALGRASAEATRCLREVLPLGPFLAAPTDPVAPARPIALDPRAPIRFESVSFAYGDPGDGAPRALDAVTFRWEPNECLALSGPNGSGKSTLLRLLLRLADPQQGTVSVGGLDLRQADPTAWRRGIAYLAQRPYVPENLDVRAFFRLLEPEGAEPRWLEALERMGMRERLGRSCVADPLATKLAELSVGERQKVALARTLAREVPLLVLDEPETNLDATGIDRLVAAMPELARTRRVVFAAHDPRLLACADRVVELGPAGRVVG